MTTHPPHDPSIPTRPCAPGFARHWALDETVVYLNHGSFGACPREVLAAQRALRDRMEAEAVRFFVEELWGLLDDSRRAIGEFVNCPWEDVAPIPNATTAVATVIENATRTLGPTGGPLIGPGDEVLINQQEYPACRNNIRFHASRVGATVVVADLPFPLSPDAAQAEQAVVDAVLAKVTARTRLALVSHVTSSTGLVLPVGRIVRELEARGVATLVDGAHAPGMLPVDLKAINPSFYTANCHKWICSPKGSAFLYVRRDLRTGPRAPGGFRPLVLSNNSEVPRPGREPFHTEFDYTGTNDFTAFMSIPAAIKHMGSMLGGGWPELMRRNRELCLKGRGILCAELGMSPTAPDSMIGSICTMILPALPLSSLPARPTRYHDPLQDIILDKYRIQVPLWGLPGRPERFVRISAQLYNSAEQYAYLGAILKLELEAERRLARS